MDDLPSDPLPSPPTPLWNWVPCPEGALLREDRQLAVIADVHLGYDWARAASGDLMPAYCLDQTIARLDRLVKRCAGALTQLIVAGDLLETAAPCRRTARDLADLRRWLDARGVALEVVVGNHDRGRQPNHPSAVTLGGWTIAHGDRPRSEPRLIVGHVHPALRCEGRFYPCFLISETTIVLPAFSHDAAGVDLRALDWSTPPLNRLDSKTTRCLVVALGEELSDDDPRDHDGVVLDFGTVAALIAPGVSTSTPSRRSRRRQPRLSQRTLGRHAGGRQT
ncbi:hypothetical protein Isop_3577 [Isosphaera pallida ATCC 43644]|uniref:Metallophosphoesterase n=1 Tax=Isosphaera pallida (strain ATCC 43644 / DSM 9630 / IS1B) TaxID=575540 RepID=E8QYF1_ISOPI|nr:hypothetical protein [Isosphaera pallida]ADV64134.1 hypothetical protein Isop_3577 [Isosphaera pallida ATCC 43644]